MSSQVNLSLVGKTTPSNQPILSPTSFLVPSQVIPNVMTALSPPSSSSSDLEEDIPIDYLDEEDIEEGEDGSEDFEEEEESLVSSKVPLDRSTNVVPLILSGGLPSRSSLGQTPSAVQIGPITPINLPSSSPTTIPSPVSLASPVLTTGPSSTFTSPIVLGTNQPSKTTPVLPGLDSGTSLVGGPISISSASLVSPVKVTQPIILSTPGPVTQMKGSPISLVQPVMRSSQLDIKPISFSMSTPPQQIGLITPGATTGVTLTKPTGVSTPINLISLSPQPSVLSMGSGVTTVTPVTVPSTPGNISFSLANTGGGAKSGITSPYSVPGSLFPVTPAGVPASPIQISTVSLLGQSPLQSQSVRPLAAPSLQSAGTLPMAPSTLANIKPNPTSILTVPIQPVQGNTGTYDWNILLPKIPTEPDVWYQQTVRTAKAGVAVGYSVNEAIRLAKIVTAKERYSASPNMIDSKEVDNFLERLNLARTL